MINRASLIQWRSQAPWVNNEQVEQDLIICRALIAIFNDDFLASQVAFRGGTALHKLHIVPQSRYSYPK
jgi:predicted nucleotidyltransferase component of viral defense system